MASTLDVSVVHVITGLHPSNGGPAECVPRLCASLTDIGCDIRLLALWEPGSPKQDFIEYHAPTLPWSILSIQSSFSRGMWLDLRTSSRKVSIIHSHGFWRMPNIYAGCAATYRDLPLVVSVHGMLHCAALSRARMSKRLFWNALQGPAYKNVSVWHATSEAEAEAIRAFGLKQPIAVIPNGVDVPKSKAIHTSEKVKRNVLFLSRLNAHKGVSELVTAWKTIEEQRPDWKLTVAGSGDDAYIKKIASLIGRLKLRNVQLVGSVHGIEKEKAYKNADLFVLPSKSENFGLVVAEALSFGVPVVVSKGAPWKEVLNHRCGWWTDITPESLSQVLLEATALRPEERSAMGYRGRAWMEQEYDWNMIANKMHLMYTWLIGGGDSPSFIY